MAQQLRRDYSGATVATQYLGYDKGMIARCENIKTKIEICPFCTHLKCVQNGDIVFWF